MGEVGSRALNISQRRVTRELARRCRSEGIPIGVYTVDTDRGFRHLMDLGVNAIFTNHPDRLRELVDEDILGSLADFHYSLMGATHPKDMEGAARHLAAVMKSDHVDAVLLVPV